MDLNILHIAIETALSMHRRSQKYCDCFRDFILLSNTYTHTVKKKVKIPDFAGNAG